MGEQHLERTVGVADPPVQKIPALVRTAIASMVDARSRGMGGVEPVDFARWSIESNAVPGFLPSTNGLRFANRFPPGPTLTLGPIDPRWIGIGDASAGLCGGMSWYVRERFAAALPVPPDTEPPANGTPLFQALVRRQVQSLDWLRTPLRFWWMGPWAPEHALQRTGGGMAAYLAPTSMPGRSRHDRPRPADRLEPAQADRQPPGPRLCYEVDGYAVTIRLYDPNWPARDDVSIRLNTGLSQSTGEQLFGVLRLGLTGGASEHRRGPRRCRRGEQRVRMPRPRRRGTPPPGRRGPGRRR